MTAEAAPPARLGEVLQNMRQRARMSIGAIAEHASVSEMEIAAYENGNAVPPWDVVESYLVAVRAPHTTRGNLRTSWSAEVRLARTDPHRRRAPEPAPPARITKAGSPSARPRTLTERNLDYLRDNGVTDPEKFVVSRAPRQTDLRLAGNRHVSAGASDTPADTSLWPVPEETTTVSEFAKAMSAIRMSTGHSFKKLAAATRATTYSSPSALWTMCTPSKIKLPRQGGRVVAFILACGGSLELAVRWFETWQKLAQAESKTLAETNEELRPAPETAPHVPVLWKYLAWTTAALTLVIAGIWIGAVML